MNDAFHFVRRDIERLFLRSAGGIIGHELGQSPDFGHRCAHAITKPFAHLRNRLFSAGGAVDLNDQFASSQLDIGKNGCAVLHGCHKSLPAFGRSWCPLLRHRRQPVPERVARRFQPLSRVQPANHAFADHALCQRKNDTVEHKVITVGVDHIRRAAGNGLTQTVEQPHVREHRPRCPQERVLV